MIIRRLLLLAVFTIGATFATNAQIISENALGVRFGGFDGYGAEVSYQRAVGVTNQRVEVDLGFRTDSQWDAVELIGIYQWVWNIEGGWNWYLGAGAGAGYVDADIDRPFGEDQLLDEDDEDGAYGMVVGNVGIEYNFQGPWMISASFRPELSFGDDDINSDFQPDVGVSVRYQF